MEYKNTELYALTNRWNYVNEKTDAEFCGHLFYWIFRLFSVGHKQEEGGKTKLVATDIHLLMIFIDILMTRFYTSFQYKKYDILLCSCRVCLIIGFQTSFQWKTYAAFTVVLQSLCNEMGL